MSENRCNDDQSAGSASEFPSVGCENQTPDHELSHEEAIARLTDLRARTHELEMQINEQMS